MIQSLERAFRILDTVAGYNTWVGVREVARVLDLKVPTVQNLLKTLSAGGYLEFNPEMRGYRIGVAPLLLTGKVDPVQRLGGVVRPSLEVLFNEFGETTTCTAMFGGRIIVVDSITSAEPLTVIHPRRVIENPQGLASGQLLLAYAPDEVLTQFLETEEFPDLGSSIPGSAEELKTRLAEVKEAGYAEVENALGHGVGAVAVPVFGPGGDIAVVLACSAPLTRFDRDKRVEVRKFFMKTASELEKKMGKAS